MMGMSTRRAWRFNLPAVARDAEVRGGIGLHKPPDQQKLSLPMLLVVLPFLPVVRRSARGRVE